MRGKEQNVRARLQLQQRPAEYGANELVQELAFPYITCAETTDGGGGTSFMIKC